MSQFWLWRPAAGDAPLVAQVSAFRGEPLELTLICADLATFAAYAVIPLLILYFLLRRRQVHFSRVWFLLLMYLIVGGAVHVLDACGNWEPVVHLAAALKGVVAFIAGVRGIVLSPLVAKLSARRSAR